LESIKPFVINDLGLFAFQRGLPKNAQIQALLRKVLRKVKNDFPHFRHHSPKPSAAKELEHGSRENQKRTNAQGIEA
jgi:hypothetical protein